MVFAGITLIILATTVSWTSSSTKVTERNNTYNRAVSAAEAATETVIARMARDFCNQSINYSDLSPYRQVTPATYLTNDWPSEYQFSDNNGGINLSGVTSSGQTISTNVDAQLPGLYGLVFPCRVTSAARRIGSPGYDVAAAVQQDFQLASIPIYQFEAFSSLDLEINPGKLMKITGKVHGNADMYLAPAVGLEFVDAIETTGQIYEDRKADDPLYGSAKVAPVYDNTHLSKANSLVLPIGTNNAPSEVVKVLDPPPALESPLSPVGSQRYYNRVDLIVTVSPAGSVSLKSGRWNNLQLISPDVTNAPPTYSFIKTNATFFDYREGKFTITTDFDVAAFSKWLTNAGALLNGVALTNMGHNLNSIYIDDQRSVAGKLTVARVNNGVQLPPDGLTVATHLPLYVKGSFNAPDLTPGSTNTTLTRPASLVGDAISILSANWTDSAVTNSLAGRIAADTTINAAFLAGIVQTTNILGTKHYSGGLENFPRFLEDWTGKTFTYNGSMVLMFPSRYATSFWQSTGIYYNAPTRQWAFDQNFRTQALLPPVTPQVRKLLRGQWTVIAAN